MAHTDAPVLKPRSEIASKAKDIHPLKFTARTLLTTISFVFVALGLIAGSLWFSVVFSFLWIGNRAGWLGQCIRYGFHKGARHEMVPKE